MDNIQENTEDYGKRTFTILSDNSETRAVFNGTNGSLWKATDKIGVACTYGRYGYVTDETIQSFSISNAGDAETVEIGEFTGTLTDKGSKTYVYYAYTPYAEGVSTENLEEVPCVLPSTQYPTATSWDSDADYMVAYPVEQTSDNVGGNNDMGFRFTRVFGMLRLSFDESWTSLYGDKKVKSVTITAGENDKLAGDFTLDIMNEPSETSTQIVRYTMSSNASNSIKLDYTDKNILFKDLQAYFMLNSGTYENVEIVVALEGVVITANRPNLTITRGSLLSAPVSKKVEDNLMDLSYIEITSPGSLESQLNDMEIDLSVITELKLVGIANKADFSTIRLMKNITSLDLGGVVIDGIHSFALADMTKLEIIVLPDSITYIEYDAFDDCRNLTSITIGSNLERVEYCAFEDLENLKEVHISDIAAYCKISFERDFYTNPLYHTDNLYLNGELVTNLVIPDGVTSIGDYAFSGCEFLTSVTIPDGSTFIGNYAFSGCSSLANVNIPDSVTSIGEWAFNGCLDLPVEGGLRYVGTFLIEAVDKSLSTYTIKQGTKFIGISAFSGCTNLASIAIPDSITEIGKSAFSGCTSLTSITIPNSVTSIGEWAFSDCSSLARIDVGSGVATMGRNAFHWCNNLKEVHIVDIASWCQISYPKDSYTANPLYVAKHLYYNGELVTDLVVPEGVTSISSFCMVDYDQLKSVALPSTTKTVGMQAFDWCDNLTTIYCKAPTPPGLYYYVEYSADADYNDYYYYSISKNAQMEIYVPRVAYEIYMQYNYAWEDAYDPYSRNWYLYKSFIKPYDFE